MENGKGLIEYDKAKPGLIRTICDFEDGAELLGLIQRSTDADDEDKKKLE